MQPERRGQRREPGAATGSATGNFLVTSSVLPESEYPQFASDQAADWLLSGGAAFDPHTGSKYMYSQNASEGYKRMTRTVDLSGVTAPSRRTCRSGPRSTRSSTGTSCSSRRAPSGQDDWTTLPTRTGTRARTPARAARRAGMSCTRSSRTTRRVRSGRHGDNVHADRDDAGRGTPSSGNSGGWQNWSIDLSAYRGKQVEISIVFATDWGIAARAGRDGRRHHRHGRRRRRRDVVRDQGDLGGWTVPGAHAGSPSTNVNDWIQSERIPFEDAAVTADRVRPDVRVRPRGRERRRQPRRADGTAAGLPAASSWSRRSLDRRHGVLDRALDLSKMSRARSRCSRSCVAITLVRSSAPPRWTAG